MRGGEDYIGWGIDRYLLAGILDAQRETTWAVIAANSGKKKPKPPEPVERPGKKKKQAGGTNKNLFAQMAAQRLNAVRKAKNAGG